MHWKTLLINCGIIFITVLLSVKLLLPGRSSQSEQMQNISERLSALESHLNRIETSLEARNEGPSKTYGRPAVLEEISQSLRAIKDSLARIENKGSGVQGSPGPRLGPSDGPAVPGGRAPITKPYVQGNPTAWISELSGEKRTAVEEIFSRHAESLRSKFPSGPPPDPGTMKKIMDESEQELRNSLKSVLSESEYRKFLDSLPKPPRAPGSFE